MDNPAADTAPAALNDLIAAGLVSHEVIGDPGRLGAEAETLRTLCGLVTGPVWRIDAFHYAFRAQPGDLGGTARRNRPRGLERGARDRAAGRARSRRHLGEPGRHPRRRPRRPRRAAPAAPGAGVGGEGGLADGLEAPSAPLQAVISARYAAEVARLTAGAAPGSALDAAARRDRDRDRNRARGHRHPARGAHRGPARPDEHRGGDHGTPPRPSGGGRSRGRRHGRAGDRRRSPGRLDAQAAALEALGERIAALIATAVPGRDPELDDFRESVGLTLAEFLARIETGAAIPH